MAIVRTLLVALGLYAALCGYVFAIQHRLVYLPGTASGGGRTPADLGLDYEDVTIETHDGVRVHGWLVPASGPHTLLFFHGNAGDIALRLESVAQFHELGFSVLIVDYRGYGRSGGRPSERGTYLDAEAAWRYLTDVRGTEPGDIVVFGRSLGAAVAAWLAVRHEPRGLVVESAFTSVPDLASELYWFLPVRWLSRVRYPTRDYVAAARCPVLVAHSRDDEIVPYAHGEAIYAAASEPRSMLELEGGHNDTVLRIAHGGYGDGLERFFESLGED